jgi:lipopolysaccharide transport system permease protein
MRLALKSSLPPDVLPPVRIRPPGRWAGLDWRELWEYRELLYFLIWRDLKVRYKQTLLGVGWVVLQPLATTLVFTLIFGELARLPSGDLPYAVFALAGLLPWSFFASAVTRGASSLVGNAHLLSKVYFPRLLVPLASALGGLVDAAVNCLLLVLLGLALGVPPAGPMAAAPLALLVVLCAGMGAGLILAALNVRYRDVNYIVPVIIQFWFYASPVVYAASVIPERFRFWYGLNPMTGAIEAFRWAVYGGEPVTTGWVAASAAGALLLLILGLVVFRRMEDSFADVA